MSSNNNSPAADHQRNWAKANPHATSAGPMSNATPGAGRAARLIRALGATRGA
jgi:hypothetical protein